VLVRHPSLHGTTAAGYQLPVPVQLERHSTGSLRGCAESTINNTICEIIKALDGINMIVAASSDK